MSSRKTRKRIKKAVKAAGRFRVFYGNSKVKSEKNGRKIRFRTITIDMGSCTGCPSAAAGLCKVCKMHVAGIKVNCYGRDIETWLSSVKDCHEGQAVYWNSHTVWEMIADWNRFLSRKENGIQKGLTIEAVRFSVNGDMASLQDAYKVLQLAKYFRKVWGVQFIWTYTANRELARYFDEQPFITVKGSGYKSAHGSTSVILGHDTPLPRGFMECLGDCSKCKRCAIRGLNVCFRAHGGTVNVSRPLTVAENMEIWNTFYGAEFPESFFELQLAA